MQELESKTLVSEARAAIDYWPDEQDHEVQNTPSEMLRQCHHSRQEYNMRPPFNMGLRDVGGESRYLRDDLDNPRLSADLMNGLAFPPEDPSIEGLGLPAHRQDGHRIFEESPRGMSDELQGLASSRHFLPEDELLVIHRLVSSNQVRMLHMTLVAVKTML